MEQLPTPDKPAALVTGAAKRMGRAYAEALVRRGHPLAVHYNSSSDEAEAFAELINAAGGRSAAFGADLADDAAVSSLMDRANSTLGAVGVLVNSASVFEDDSWDTLTAASFRRHLDINALSPMLLSQAFAKQAPDAAMILNVLDYKLFNVNADYFSYSISKFALKAMTEMLARALAPNVRVNAIAPGLTLPSPYHSQEEFERLHSDNPLGVGPTLDDMVRTLDYFLDTPTVSGWVMPVDGGQHFDPRLTRDVFGALEGNGS
ncbi:MAG: SDR family oxidoreductase [Pseudomonadota bacterium]